jgi:diguanylate cyclase (GGDEF)-like protein
MKSELREHDTLARIGGDEFVVLLEEIETKQCLCPIIQRLLAVAASPYRLNGIQVQASASIGISFNMPTSHATDHELLRQVDLAMYTAKTSGKNRYAFYAVSKGHTAFNCS